MSKVSQITFDTIGIRYYSKKEKGGFTQEECLTVSLYIGDFAPRGPRLSMFSVSLENPEGSSSWQRMHKHFEKVSPGLLADLLKDADRFKGHGGNQEELYPLDGATSIAMERNDRKWFPVVEADRRRNVRQHRFGS